MRSLLGSRSRLQDVPKIAQLVEARLHAWFDERCVEPRFQQIVLPSFWPRKRNTRGGTEEEAGAEGTAVPMEGRGEDDGGDGRAVADGNGNGGVGGEEEEGTRAKAKAGGERMDGWETRPPVHPEGSLEARMVVEGQKIREAEERAQRAERERRERRAERNGVRWRGDHDASRSASQDSIRLPGNMPGALVS